MFLLFLRAVIHIISTLILNGVTLDSIGGYTCSVTNVTVVIIVITHALIIIHALDL